jgi:hypothetical protein
MSVVHYEAAIDLTGVGGQLWVDMSPSTDIRGSESCDAAQNANVGQEYGYLFQLACIEM